MTKFDAGWKLTIFVALFVPLFIALGFWQLDRADEKRQILGDLKQRQAQAPRLFSPEQFYESYTPVTVRGHYDGRHFLIDNQVVSGRTGFDVLSVFQEERGNTLLINRGFIEASSDRLTLPLVPTPNEVLSLSGSVSRNLGEPFLLEDQKLNIEAFTESSVELIQAFEPALLKQFLPEWQVGDWFLRLDLGQVSAFETHYQPVRMMPEKHTGYAVQWFAMAFALIAIYCLLGFGVLKSKVVSSVSDH